MLDPAGSEERLIIKLVSNTQLALAGAFTSIWTGQVKLKEDPEARMFDGI